MTGLICRFLSFFINLSVSYEDYLNLKFCLRNINVFQFSSRRALVLKIFDSFNQRIKITHKTIKPARVKRDTLNEPSFPLSTSIPYINITEDWPARLRSPFDVPPGAG